MSEINKQRYLNAMHAMQSGVAMKMNYSPGETQPKHLRVGINAAMVEFSALQKLLLDKGLITEDEFYEYLANMAEEEVKRYADWLSEHLKTTVTLA